MNVVAGNPGREHILTTPVEVVHDGYMELPSGPGWGVELNEDFLRAAPPGADGTFPSGTPSSFTTR